MKAFKMMACFIAVSLVLFSLGCEPTPTYQGKAKILILPGPFSLPMMEARCIFLADYLTKETGWKINMVAAPPKADPFLKMVETERVAFSLQNPYLYLLLAKRYGAVPIVKTVSLDGRAEYRGLIVVREGSQIKLLRDLVGKEILAPSRFNVGGFLAQWILLKEHGLDPERDVTYKFGVAQEEILERIALGQAEVGFVREDVPEALIKAEGKMPKVKVIATTTYYPNHCFVQYPDTDPALAQKLTSALLKLDFKNPSHRFILERLRISGFAPASPEDFTNFRNQLLSYGLFSPKSIPPPEPLKRE